MKIIGIDTGVTTGISLWNSATKQFEIVTSMKIHKAMDFVRLNKPDFIRVEDARLRTFYGNADFRQEKSGAGIREGVGSVKRDAGIWEDFLKDENYAFELVHPKTVKTKLTQKEFKRMTGWQKITNEHSRDSGMMVFGYSTKQIERSLEKYRGKK